MTDIAIEPSCPHPALMRTIRILAVLAALVSATTDVRAGSAKAVERYELKRSYLSSRRGSDGSASNSRGHSMIVERVIGPRGAGLELEYDLSDPATKADRRREWQLPARVLRPPSGPMQLLNRAELEARLARWLKAAKWTRAVCGRTIFTWTAFRIECDPQSAIKMIEGFDLRAADLRDGALHQESGARAPGRLVKGAAVPGGTTFTVLLDVDPDAVRRARAESDVTVGEITRVPVALDAALRERGREAVSGTIAVTFEVDAAGKARKRTTVSKVDVKLPDGATESETRTETTERRPL